MPNIPTELILEVFKFFDGTELRKITSKYVPWKPILELYRNVLPLIRYDKNIFIRPDGGIYAIDERNKMTSTRFQLAIKTFWNADTALKKIKIEPSSGATATIKELFKRTSVRITGKEIEIEGPYLDRDYRINVDHLFTNFKIFFNFCDVKICMQRFQDSAYCFRRSELFRNITASTMNLQLYDNLGNGVDIIPIENYLDLLIICKENTSIMAKQLYSNVTLSESFAINLSRAIIEVKSFCRVR